MRNASVVFVLFLAGCGRSNRDPRIADAKWNSEIVTELRNAGRQAFSRGAYLEAAGIFQRGASDALASSDPVSAGRFLADRGGAILAAGEHREALRELLRARDIAGAARDLSTLQSIEGNLVSLYSIVGDMEAAYVAATRGAALRPPSQGHAQRIQFLLLFGRAAARSRGLGAAREIFSEALASAAGDWPRQALVLEAWGNEHRRAGDLAAAEDFLMRAWRARVLGNDPARSQTEYLLATVLRMRGEVRGARFWRNRAAAGAAVPVLEWARLTEEAQLLEAEGDAPSALRAYRAAMESARAWRARIPAVDRARLAAELSLNDTFEGFLRVAARELRKQPALGGEMFAALQNHRAWSLIEPRAVSSSEQLLATARRLEGAWLGGDSGARVQLAGVRAEILEKEISVASSAGPQADWKEPPGDHAVLSFWLHEEGSLLLLWTGQGLRVAHLAPKSEIEALAAAFRQATASGIESPASIRLFDALLGPLRAEALRFGHWDIVAPEELALIPFAALRPSPDRYLVELVETRLIPNAWSLPAAPRTPARFLGFSDPVFNLADERMPAISGRAKTKSHWAYQLPRLPATRRETEAAATAWRSAGFDANVRHGVDCAEESVISLLRDGNPEIVHIATHTAAPDGEEGRPRLALSLRADGSPGLLTADDISSLRCQANLVVMSACHSAGAPAPRGAGWIGLTRAWLSAGARQVVSTLWPVTEDSSFFYARLHGEMAAVPAARRDAARALRSAQLACLREPGSRAMPAYWAAHFLLARR